jgi:hypothetical protein
MLYASIICIGFAVATYGMRITSIAGLTKEALISNTMKVALPLLTLVPQNAVSSDNGVESVQEAADLVSKYCKKSLEISQRTGRVLYRGTNVAQLPQGLAERKLSPGKSSVDNSNLKNKVTIESPRSDLLLQGTYNNPLSTDYFTALDQELSSVYKESDHITLRNGHIATTDSQLASLWGPIVAVFPIDDSYYCTLKHEKKWFNDDWVARGNNNFLFWKQKEKLKRFVRNELVFNNMDSIESAYSKGSEVLFTSNSSLGQYIAIPLQYLGKLLLLLNIEPYTTKVKVTRAPAIEVDEVKQRRKPLPREIIYF